MERRTWFALAGLTAALLAAGLLLPVGRWSAAVIAAVHGAGAKGVAGYVGIYALAGLTLLPITVFTMGAGFLFGPGWGFVLVFPTATLTAMAGFALGRTVLRRRAARALQGYPRFAALDRALGRGGFRLALLVRLSPLIPFGLTNYALGTTQLDWGTYLGTTVVSGVPWIWLHVWMGSAAGRLGDLAAGAPAGYRDVVRWGGLALAVVVMALLVVAARRALEKELGR